MKKQLKGKSLQERFDSQYIPEPNSGCWLWTGALITKGYGCIKHQGKSILAHRASLILEGIDFTGKLVMHSCDNPMCVNPKHLSLGTNRENILDASKKGRICHGERHPLAQFNEESVRAIRDSEGNGADLARAYGVTRSAVYAVKKRKTWKHVI